MARWAGYSGASYACAWSLLRKLHGARRLRKRKACDGNGKHQKPNGETNSGRPRSCIPRASSLFAGASQRHLLRAVGGIMLQRRKCMRNIDPEKCPSGV